jgi:hypothetical protein
MREKPGTDHDLGSPVIGLSHNRGLSPFPFLANMLKARLLFGQIPFLFFLAMAHGIH